MTQAVAQDEDLLIIADSSDASNDDMHFSFDFGTEVGTPEAAPQEEALSVNPTASDVILSDTAAVLSESNTLEPTQEAPKMVFGIELDTPSIIPQNEVKIENSEIQIEEPLVSEIQTPVESPVMTESNWGPCDPLTSEERATVSPQTADTTPIMEIPAPVTQEMPQETLVNVVPEGAAEVRQETNTIVIPQAAAEVNVSGQSESLNDILTATIAKLALRAEAITQDSSGKSAQIADIQAQIKVLEEQVANLEGAISLLTTESEKISKNIEALEEMKLDPVKEHNARRVAKK